MVELINLNNKELRITSVELVKIINDFRKLESETNSKEYKELKHSDFMKKIRKEFEVLNTLGLGGQGNISSAKYNDEQGKERDCYSLNGSGMRMMLNSESTIVRFKTEEYIENLEKENKKLKSQLDNKALLLLDIYNGGQAGIVASKQLAEIEVKEAVEPLNKKIKEDSPFVSLAKERLAKGEKISLTDATKSLKLKKGQISTFLKINGYLHKSQTEVNSKGDNLFKVYKEKGFNCIGILEEGIRFINDHLEEIKNSPCCFSKNYIIN